MRPARAGAVRRRIELDSSERRSLPAPVDVALSFGPRDVGKRLADRGEGDGQHGVTVGEAPELDAAASPFAADIRFLDHVPESDLPALLSGALALVSPSLSEGFELPPLEAMACETRDRVERLVAAGGGRGRRVAGRSRGSEATRGGLDAGHGGGEAAGRPPARELRQAQRYFRNETAPRTVEVCEHAGRAG
jgi:glycosyltransferase involved in cell wall biosynthesis